MYMVGVHVPLCSTQCAVALKISEVYNICKEHLISCWHDILEFSHLILSLIVYIGIQQSLYNDLHMQILC